MRISWASIPSHPLRVLCIAVVLMSAAASCSGSGGQSATSGSAPASADPNFEGTRVKFDPANFVDPTLDTNPYHPLKPGLQWVRGGTTEVGTRVVPHEIITTMTDVVRVIDGVPTIAMLEETTDAGEVSQQSIDYMGLDKDGNVWLLGGYTEDFEGGQYTNTETAWLGDGEGASMGILAPRNVDMSTRLAGSSAWDPTKRPTVGEPVKVGVTEMREVWLLRQRPRGPGRSFVGAPDNENKYYAPGVGVIKNVPWMRACTRTASSCTTSSN